MKRLVNVELCHFYIYTATTSTNTTTTVTTELDIFGHSVITTVLNNNMFEIMS